jgi:hypothetical protein
MADTRQIVSWALERKCAFRSGDQWFLPARTCSQLADLRTVASAKSDGRLADGVCVTSWTTAQDNAGNMRNIPYSGFRVEEQLKPVGGLTSALATCAACEANVKTELALDVAGCFGHLDIWPDSDELDQQLWKIIEQHKLESRFRAAFPVTTPLWYGLWISSPLRRVQVEILLELLEAARDQDGPKDSDVGHFLGAMKAALQWELPVHVALAPLGHIDLGWYTIFPHCPRCKANAPVGRWRESYADTPHTCEVCGHIFNPNEQHSSKQDTFDWDAYQLDKNLGAQGYQLFVRKYLLHQGCSPEQADQVIDNKNQGPLLRRIKKLRLQRDHTLERLRKPADPCQLETWPANFFIALDDATKLELVMAPAGQLLMGSSDAEANPDELPQHLVRFSRPFYIGRFPVKQAHWTAVMGRNPSTPISAAPF